MLNPVKDWFLGGSLFTPLATLSVEAKVIHLPTIHLEIKICLSPRYENCLVVLSEGVTYTQVVDHKLRLRFGAKMNATFFQAYNILRLLLSI